MPADKKNMKGQGKRKGRREEVKMEQGKEKEERRRRSLCKIMPVVSLVVILIAVMIHSVLTPSAPSLTRYLVMRKETTLIS